MNIRIEKYRIDNSPLAGAQPILVLRGAILRINLGPKRDRRSCPHRRRRHRRAGDGPHAAPDRRALRRVRSGARDAPARRRHQPAAQRRARALRSRHHQARARPRRPAGARNGRWSGSTATTSIPSRAGSPPATTGRSTRCIAASFHMLLYDKVVERIGPDAVRLGSRVTGYRKNSDGGVTALIEHADGSTSEANGALLIGADGIHSAVRAQMHPAQPPIHWGGAIMWRGTTWGKPIRSGASFVGLGTHRQRVVFYPISHPDPGDRPRDDQLDRRGDDGQLRGLEAERLVPAGRHRRLPPPFRGLDLGLARRAGPDPAAPTASSRTR